MIFIEMDKTGIFSGVTVMSDSSEADIFVLSDFISEF